MTLRKEIDDRLEPLGLTVLAVFEKKLFLIGNAGPSLSYLFEQLESPEGDPLDLWSKKVLAPIAEEFQAEEIYPFEGPPFHPFVRWALESGELFESPLGFPIHPKYGFWHGYRGALLFEEEQQLQEIDASSSPCDSCSSRPCLSVCKAFSDKGFQHEICRGQMIDKGCLTDGCAARLSCPIGDEFRYSEKQIAFHMKALIANWP